MNKTPMQILRFKTETEWLEARRGIVTGTMAKEVMPKARGEGYRTGFYQILAERVAIPHNGENVMDRGKRLEDEAIEAFSKETKIKVKAEKFVLCVNDEYPDLGYSPDGLIGMTKDVEVKCLNSAHHIETWLSKKMPVDYEAQMIHAFVVNPKLKTRYMIFYDPRCPISMFFLMIERKDYKEKIAEYFEFEKKALELMNSFEKQLTF